MKNLKEKSEKGIRWFQSYKMIVNPGKFQTVLTDKKGKSKNPTKIMPDGKHIKSNDTATLLGIEIDRKSNFDKHISKLCNKSASL